MMKIDQCEIDELRKFECINAQATISFKDGDIDPFIKSKYWPLAVQEDMIVRTDGQIRQRSAVIVKAYIDNIFSKRFLDFGCGMGHTTIEASKSAKIAVGYDPVRHSYWSSQESRACNNCYLSHSFDLVQQNAPYDFVLLYDVLDHILPAEIPSVLEKLASVCNSNTIIKCRCHPWTSIHGGHLYEKLNRAFAHLLLSEEEIIANQSTGTTRIMRPLATYKRLLTQHFDILSTEPVTIKMSEDVRFILSDDNIIKRIKQSTGGDKEWQSTVLTHEYIDYILKVKVCK